MSSGTKPCKVYLYLVDCGDLILAELKKDTNVEHVRTNALDKEKITSCNLWRPEREISTFL